MQTKYVHDLEQYYILFADFFLQRETLLPTH